jgi:hypothetical protein
MKYYSIIFFLFIAFYEMNAQVVNYSSGHGRHENIYRTRRDAVNYFPDSIRVEFPEQESIVVFELKRFENHSSFIESFPATLLELDTYLEKSLPGHQKGEAVTIHVVYKLNNEKEISIQETKPQTTVLIKDQQIIQLLPPGIEIFIQTETAKVYLYIPERSKLRELADKNFKQIVSHVREESKNYYIGRKSFKARFIVENNTISYSNVLHTEPRDFLYLTASAGVGVFRDKLYPELSPSIGLSFSDRFNRTNHKVELTYSSMYMLEKKAEGGYTNSISSFLGITYRKNFGIPGGRSMWTGVGAAVLVNETENFFKGKTAKFFFFSDIGNTRLNIVPEFYLTEDFKKLQFGMKLTYAF